jgi:glycosyltransferase involved in cell wall biosynthesis
MVGRDRLKIFLVSDKGGDDDEGMKKIARHLAKSLQERGIIVKIVSIIEAIEKNKETAIFHFVGGPSYRSVLIAAWCKLRNVSKTILTFSNPRWNRIADATVRLLSPDKVIVSSNYWKNWATQTGIPFEFMAISGVDLNRFSPVSDSKKVDLRKELGLPLDKSIVLHVGHLKEDRNLKKLLEIQSHPDIQVIVIGSTTTKQSEEIAELLTVAGCVVIREYLPKIEIFYQVADCYIFPTTDHRAAVQIPLSILEAMAVSLPVVTTRLGGLPDFFPGTNGITFLPDNKGEDLAAIIKIAISKASSVTGSIQSFAWEKIAERLHRVYINIMG